MRNIAPTTRQYVCKYCGLHITESYASWKKKPQKHKNHCPTCLRNRIEAEQTRQEMAYANPYKYSI